MSTGSNSGKLSRLTFYDPFVGYFFAGSRRLVVEIDPSQIVAAKSLAVHGPVGNFLASFAIFESFALIAESALVFLD
jgi:hypothetical protein